MQHLIFSGFELQLYRLDEWYCIYWMGNKVFEEHMQTLNGLLQDRRDRLNWKGVDERAGLTEKEIRSLESINFLESQVEMIQALHNASAGMMEVSWFLQPSTSSNVHSSHYLPLALSSRLQMLRATSSSSKPSFPLSSSSTSSSTYPSSLSLEKSTFLLRFKFLNPSSSTPALNQVENFFWPSWVEERTRSVLVQDSESLKLSIKFFEEATDVLEKLMKRSGRERKTELCEARFGEVSWRDDTGRHYCV